METAIYVLTVALAGLLASAGLIVPTLIVAGVAVALVFRREINQARQARALLRKPSQRA